ncbi:EthD family reductase [Rhodococcus olei]|uniref:EthD family reductase n=1 Tax=Rhodococcus olei TaxID=2161675 RepID=A0ABP8PCK9_9NOCA
MTAVVVVCYGRPEDPDAFEAYYRDVHLPLARAVPGLSRLTWGRCAALGGGEPRYHMVARLEFPDAATMSAGLASTEMTAAGRDVRNFATGGVTMFTQEEQSVGSCS